MKLYAIVEINDDMYDDKKKWYITGGDLNVGYVEDDIYMRYKWIEDDMLELKPLPQKRDKSKVKIVVGSEEEATNMQILINQCSDIGFNACLGELLGDNDE